MAANSTTGGPTAGGNAWSITDIKTVVVVLAVLALAILLVVVVRFLRRSSGPPRQQLTPATDVGGDIAYRYYVDPEGLRSLATSLDIDLPVKRQVTDSGEIAAGAPGGGLGAKRQRQVVQELPSEINLAALARWVRGLGGSYVCSDLARLSDVSTGSDLSEVKSAEFRTAAGSNTLILLRAQFEVAQFDPDQDAAPIYLHVTHLSTEQLRPHTYPGVGNSAAALMPQALTLRVVLPSASLLEPAVRERFERQEPFFGEAIAHSPSFTGSSGTFACTAYAVWGCPSPSADGGEETGVAY